ncbi:hypothetical protein V6Z11_D06G173500 [Gossypium hirsutum]
MGIWSLGRHVGILFWFLFWPGAPAAMRVGLGSIQWCMRLWWIAVGWFLGWVPSGLAWSLSVRELASALSFAGIYLFISLLGVDDGLLVLPMVLIVRFYFYNSVDRLVLGTSLFLCMVGFGQGEVIRGGWDFSVPFYLYLFSLEFACFIFLFLFYFYFYFVVRCFIL